MWRNNNNSSGGNQEPQITPQTNKQLFNKGRLFTVEVFNKLLHLIYFEEFCLKIRFYETQFYWIKYKVNISKFKMYFKEIFYQMADRPSFNKPLIIELLLF